MDYFYKYREILFEFFKNIISFSLLIVVQQMIALPIISRYYEVEIFGKIVLAFGITNIITSTFGFSIGNARLLDNKSYNFTYIRLLHISNILIMLVCLYIYFIIFSGTFVEGLIFSITSVLGSIRLFFTSEFRIKDKHDPILKQNLYYFLGILIGVIVFYYINRWIIIFFIAEFCSVVFSYVFYLHKARFFKLFVDKSHISLSNNFQLMLNNGISYSLSQYDRFIIYPILGPASVGIYYSTSISARVGGLILNPLSNFILGKLASKQREATTKLINITIISSIITTVMYFLLTILTTPVLVWILYPSFLPMIEHLITPICLGAAFLGGATVLKPVIMKYIGVKYYNIAFVIYGFLLITLSIILCLKFSLIGLAFANLISSAFLIIYFIFSIKAFSRKFGSSNNTFIDE